VLPTEDGHSAPTHILARLKAFRSEFNLDEEDQLWYCGDIDHWMEANHRANLVQVLQLYSQAGFQVALSNPCFELWLLLHFFDAPTDAMSCSEICNKLSADTVGYSKHKGCHAQITAEMVGQAIKRAARLDEGTGDIPVTPTTRIHRILTLLIQRESIIIR
jgi:hypothetical protein